MRVSGSAAVVEQFCQANGQILMPIMNLIESAIVWQPLGGGGSFRTIMSETST
jgi:hypothetical protein